MERSGLENRGEASTGSTGESPVASGGGNKDGNGKVGNGNGADSQSRRKGPGRSPVGLMGIMLMATSLMLLLLVVLYSLVKLWPHPTPSMRPEITTAPPDVAPSTGLFRRDTLALRSPTADTLRTDQRASMRDTAAVVTALERPVGGRNQPVSTSRSMPPSTLACDSAAQQRWLEGDTITRKTAECVRLFNASFLLWDEQRLLLIVLLSGALGGLVHALRSLGWYVGNRELVWSWLLYYLMLPFTSALIAFIFYVVVRGGFFSPGSSVAETSPFGFAAFSVLVGMFSTNAVLKLKQVAETLLAKPGRGKDARPQGTSPATGPVAPPIITVVTRSRTVAGDPRDALQIRGSGFAAGATVELAGAARATAYGNETELEALLSKDEVTALEGGAKLPVTVINPDGARSKPVMVS